MGLQTRDYKLRNWTTWPKLRYPTRWWDLFLSFSEQYIIAVHKSNLECWETSYHTRKNFAAAGIPLFCC